MAKHCFCSLENNKDFTLWIMELLGPVLLGAKPAEILSFPSYKKNEVNDSIEAIKELLKDSHKIKYSSFYSPNGCIKMIFYNVKALDDTLNDIKNLRFLKKLHYPEKYDLNNYLQLLLNKLKNGEMPHEIGIFLGYPLKDVLGFMGHPSLKLTKVNGWRIYGDPKISDLKCEKIKEAKQQIKQQLERYGINFIVKNVS